VIVTGAFLAEAASVVDNKLNVSGGVLSRFVVGPDRTAAFLLVLLTQAEGDNPDRRVAVELWPPTGAKPLQIVYEVPEAAAAAEIGFAFFQLEVKLPTDGRWVLLVAGGPGVISLPLEVSS